MATRKDTAPTGAPSPASDCPATERTDARIRAFLASMRPLRGSNALDTVEYARGHCVIDGMAENTKNDDHPEVRLSPAELADVLDFLARSEPIKPRDWWQDPKKGASHVVGYHLVLGALEDALRAPNSEAPLTAETLKSLAAEMGREVSAIIVVEMALDSDYDPYPGRTETRCDLQCALREARGRLEELVERVEKLGMEIAS